MKTTKMSRILLEKHIGSEPEPNSKIENNLKLIEALNHYSYFYSREDAIQFLEKYLLENKPFLFRDRDVSKIELTLGWLARMKSRNIELPMLSEEWFSRKIKELPFKKSLNVNRAASLEDPFDSRIIATIEEMIDREEMDYSRFKEMNLPNSVVKKIVNFYVPRLTELNDIPNDPDLIEAYSYFSDEYIQNQKKILNSILDTFGVGGFVVITEKPKKVKSPEEISKWMILLSKDEDLNIKSLPAVDIVGKKTVVFYIPSHRTLQIFNAKENETLTVKGKSVINFDPENSFSKSVRKPEEVIKKFYRVANNGKLMKEFEKLTTKAKAQTTSLVSNKHILMSAF